MAEWITNIMDTLGYLGIGLLMLLENVFPPIPSEVIMPLAGFTVAQGEMKLIPAIAAGVIGTVLGALLWYYAGAIMGEKRLKHIADKRGKWIGLSSHEIDKAQKWFNQYGNIAVFVGRFIPGVRTLISLPAGLNKMSLLPFLVYSTLGTIVWVGVLAYLGYILGENYTIVHDYLGQVSAIIIISIILFVAVWIIRKKNRK